MVKAMIKIRKLKNVEDFKEYTRLFNKAIGYSNVPWQYYASGEIWSVFKESQIKGGFVLVPGYFNLRSILQMPEEVQEIRYKEHYKVMNNLCDNTGYFLNGVSFWEGIWFTLLLTLICLFYKKGYFVYTYPVTDTGLEKYYGSGKPIRIHTGVPVHLPGHSDNMEPEHVEILTRLGIIKIFLYRTKRMFRARKIQQKRLKGR